MSEPVPIPGTQTLFDSGSADDTQKKDDLILRPQPSRDPQDPLNWTPRRKALATACLALYTFFNGFAGSNLYSVLTPISEARPALTVAVLNAGTGYLFLLAGLGLFVWQPLAQQYGKRPVYLASMLGLAGMSVWGAFVAREGEWYARSVLTGFFAAPVEALPEASVADLYFVHERAGYMALYAAALVGSNFVGPLACGFIDIVGWRWVFWVTTVFCGFAFVFLFLFMEETNFDRRDDRFGADSVTVGEHRNGRYCDLSATPEKSLWQKLALKDKPRPFALHKYLGRQLLFLSWPVPLYAGFAYGSCLIWFNVMNATSSEILSAPPYSFRPQIVGLAYIAPLIGVAVAFVSVGPLSDRLAVRLARRAHGVLEPESRLYLFAVVTLAAPAGLLLWGLGAAARAHWAVLLLGMGLLGLQNAAGAALSVTYLVDSYRELAGDALASLIVVRNLMAFAVNYAIGPWIAHMGLRGAFGLAAGIGAACGLAWIPVVVFGKRVRGQSAGLYWRLVDARDGGERRREVAGVVERSDGLDGKEL